MTRKEDQYDEYDLLSQYLQEISRIPRLTPERERELGYRVQQNDRTALEELVKANLRFVVSYAKRFRNAHVLFLDLINEGNIGLIHAATKFDPDKNVKFITYAVWWIRQAILHALSEQGGAFRLPPKRANLLYRLEKTIGNMITSDNHIPTPAELAAQLGVTEREIDMLLQVGNESFSLSSELDGTGHTELGEVIEQTTVPSVEHELEQQSKRDEILQRLASLSPKERLILTLRHGVSDNIPKRIDEIAAFLNKPAEAIRTTLEESIIALCRRLAVDENELAHLLLYTNPNPRASWTYWVALGDLPAGSRSSSISPERLAHLEALQHQADVQRVVESLTLEEKTVLKLRFGILQDEELTLRDIGQLLNLSRERVRQIEARAEAKCRSLAGRKVRAR